MDASAITILASAAVSLLVPYLKNAGEELVKKAGEEIGSKTGQAAWNTAKRLYETIKVKFSSKPDTAKVLNALEKSPDDGDIQATVRFHLKDIMVVDESFVQKLADILKEASDVGADTVFHTMIYGDVQKLVQMGNVFGNVKI